MADNDKYTPEEIERAEEAKAQALLRGDENLKKFSDESKSAQSGLKGTSDELRRAKEKTKEAFKDMGSSLAAGQAGASQFNGLIDSGTSALSAWAKKLPKVGKLAAGAVKVAGAAAQEMTKQADILSKNYKNISQSGVTGADGMRGAFESIQNFGYTLNEIGDYQKLVEQNSHTAALFGGTAAQGIKKLGAVSKEIQRSDVGGKLLSMGLTIDDINTGVANYVKTQTMTGRTQKEIDDKVSKSALEYIYYQNKMSKITGQSVAELQKVREEALKEKQFGALIRNLQNSGDKDLQAKAKALQEVNENLQHTAPGLAKGLRDLAAGGKLTDEAKQVLMLMPKTAKAITAGRVSTAEVMALAKEEAAGSSKMVDSLAVYGKASGTFLDGGELARVKALKAYDERDEAATNNQKVLDKATNSIINTEKAQRNTTQQAEKLISTGLDPAITGMAKVASAADKVSTMGAAAIGVKPAGGGSVGSGGGATTGGGGAAGAAGATAATFSPSGGTAQTGTRNATSGAAMPGAAPAAETSGGFFSNLFGKKSEAVGPKPTGKNPISEIVGTGPGWLEVKRPDGKIERLEGARNWRNNNPGNIMYGDFAKGLGAIGTDGRFAIFPDYETGRKAKEALIFEGKNYSGLTLTDAIARYAPPSENNTRQYQQTILAAVENQNKVMQTYSGGERNNIMNAMERVEGYKVGTIKPATVTAANGGVATGPKSGYAATLHGTEAVVPLPNGKSIPVEMPGVSGSSEKRTKLLAKQLEIFEGMVSVQKKQVAVTNKILQLQS